MTEATTYRATPAQEAGVAYVFIEVDGEPVDWTQHLAYGGASADPDCGDCGAILPGVREGAGTPAGVRRCGTCQRHADDHDAARALAELVGGTVRTGAH